MDKNQRVATAQSDHLRADNGLAKSVVAAVTPTEWLKRRYSGGLFLVQRARNSTWIGVPEARPSVRRASTPCDVSSSRTSSRQPRGSPTWRGWSSAQDDPRLPESRRRMACAVSSVLEQPPV